MSLMTAVSTQTTLTASTATKIADSNLLRTNIKVVTTGSNVFLGGSGVSASNGYPMTANVPVDISVDGAQAALYAYCTTAYTVFTLEFKPL